MGQESRSKPRRHWSRRRVARIEVVDPELGGTSLQQRNATASVHPTSASTLGQAGREANARFRGAERETVKLSAQAVGDPTLRAKTVIELRSVSSLLSGKYCVSEAKHLVTLPGGVQLEHINLIQIVQPALTPLVPLLDLVDAVVAVFHCVKAIPDALGPRPIQRCSLRASRTWRRRSTSCSASCRNSRCLSWSCSSSTSCSTRCARRGRLSCTCSSRPGQAGDPRRRARDRAGRRRPHGHRPVRADEPRPGGRERW